MIPFVILKLDKPYKLRFGMGAQVEFEQSTGIRLKQLADELDNDPSMETIANALWAMLRRENKELTFEAVCELVDDNAENLTEITRTVSRAIEEAWAVNNLPNTLTPAK